MSTSLIRAQNLSKSFRHVDALADLTLDVPEGSVFALVGPNGAGKTTAIKTFMNILPPRAGRAEVLGVDSTRLGPAQLEQIGYVSENQQLPEWMTVRYFLNYCSKFYPAWRPEEADELARAFDLPWDRRLRNLSRGMRIKAALTSALAFRPRLLVLDEPFAGLDMLVREELIEGILERNGETTILIASHDLSEIESFATHFAYLEQGRLKFSEEMTSITDRFRQVEITLEKPAGLPSPWPADWLNPAASEVVIRFIEPHFNAERTRAEILRLFPAARDISIQPMSLRAIFVALARAGRSRTPER